MPSEIAWRDEGGPKEGSREAASLQAALFDLNRRYGPGVVSTGHFPSLGGLSTGMAELDQITGSQGLPRGRISQIEGGEGSGAIGLAVALLARISQDAPVALIDFSREVALLDLVAYGGNLENCWVVRPGRYEEGWAAARALVKAGLALCLLQAEEWRAITPQAAPAALQSAGNESGTAILVVGGDRVPAQLRERVGLALACRRLEWTRAHGDVAGVRFAVQTVRNRMGPPGRSCQLQLNFPRPYALEVGLTKLALPAMADEQASDPWVAEMGL